MRKWLARDSRISHPPGAACGIGLRVRCSSPDRVGRSQPSISRPPQRFQLPATRTTTRVQPARQRCHSPEIGATGRRPVRHPPSPADCTGRLQAARSRSRAWHRRPSRNDDRRFHEAGRSGRRADRPRRRSAWSARQRRLDREARPEQASHQPRCAGRTASSGPPACRATGEQRDGDDEKEIRGVAPRCAMPS